MIDKENISGQDRKNLLLLFILVALAAAGIIIFLWRFVGVNLNLTADTNFEKEYENAYIRVAEVKEMLDSGEDFILLDVRTDKEYTREHIEGSINIPYGDLNTQFVNLPETKLIVTMANGDSCKRGFGAAVKLDKLRFQNIRYMDAGTSGWKEAEYALISGPPEATPVSIAAIPAVDLQRRFDEDADFLLIDIRGDEEYNSGHIARATHIKYGDVEEEFNAGHLDPEKEMILYEDKNLLSEVMAESLVGLGANNVKVLENGLEGWQEAGYEITTP